MIIIIIIIITIVIIIIIIVVVVVDIIIIISSIRVTEDWWELTETNRLEPRTMELKTHEDDENLVDLTWKELQGEKDPYPGDKLLVHDENLYTGAPLCPARGGGGWGVRAGAVLSETFCHFAPPKQTPWRRPCVAVTWSTWRL